MRLAVAVDLRAPGTRMELDKKFAAQEENRAQ